MNGLVEFLNLTPVVGVDRVAGEVSLVTNEDGSVRTVVVETDGSATFIPADQFLNFKEDE